MKKTYKESWIVYCQPGSKVMDCLTESMPYVGSARVVVIQSEVITKDYILFEVIKKEDYEKYFEDTEAKVKQIQDENESLKLACEQLKKDCEQLKKDKQKLIKTIETRVELNSKLSETLKQRTELMRSVRSRIDDLLYMFDFKVSTMWDSEKNKTVNYLCGEEPIDNEVFDMFKSVLYDMDLKQYVKDYSSNCIKQ